MRSGSVSRGSPDLVSRAMPTICHGPLTSSISMDERTANGIAFGKKMLGEGLVDDSNFLAIGRIAVVDGAPRDDGDSSGLEVLAGDAIEHRVHVFFGRGGVARNIDVGGPVAAADGWSGREGDGADAGKCGKPFEQAADAEAGVWLGL